ncbi:hypothetical protein HDU92_002683 [Lobulomyces angularis]|nr:hypothetical protein HDU92_002683 [Lobulomyces angularis]
MNIKFSLILISTFTSEISTKKFGKIRQKKKKNKEIKSIKSFDVTPTEPVTSQSSVSNGFIPVAVINLIPTRAVTDFSQVTNSEFIPFAKTSLEQPSPSMMAEPTFSSLTVDFQREFLSATHPPSTSSPTSTQQLRTSTTDNFINPASNSLSKSPLTLLPSTSTTDRSSETKVEVVKSTTSFGFTPYTSSSVQSNPESKETSTTSTASFITGMVFLGLLVFVALVFTLIYFKRIRRERTVAFSTGKCSKAHSDVETICPSTNTTATRALTTLPGEHPFLNPHQNLDRPQNSFLTPYEHFNDTDFNNQSPFYSSQEINNNQYHENINNQINPFELQNIASDYRFNDINYTETSPVVEQYGSYNKDSFYNSLYNTYESSESKHMSNAYSSDFGSESDFNNNGQLSLLGTDKELNKRESEILNTYVRGI